MKIVIFLATLIIAASSTPVQVHQSTSLRDLWIDRELFELLVSFFLQFISRNCNVDQFSSKMLLPESGDEFDKVFKELANIVEDVRGLSKFWLDLNDFCQAKEEQEICLAKFDNPFYFPTMSPAIDPDFGYQGPVRGHHHHRFEDDHVHCIEAHVIEDLRTTALSGLFDYNHKYVPIIETIHHRAEAEKYNTEDGNKKDTLELIIETTQKIRESFDDMLTKVAMNDEHLIGKVVSKTVVV